MGLLASLLSSASAEGYEIGITDHSGMSGVDCTECHAAGAAVPTTVLTTPSALYTNELGSFVLTVVRGEQTHTVAGLDVAAEAGSLVCADSGTRLQAGALGAEITHVAPRPYEFNGTVAFEFQWAAPGTPGTYNIWLAVLSGDGDSSTGGDSTATTQVSINVVAAPVLPPPDPCDADGDTFDSYSCGGLDCDDTDAASFPGGTEVCGDGIDQNCDGHDNPCNCNDLDGDGFFDTACGGLDCNDDDIGINPDAIDICGDGIDQNCSGDERDCDCPDRDGDSYRDIACGGSDCDDGDVTIHPGALEICRDGIDQDCRDGDLQACCFPEEIRLCYSGPAGTHGVGLCLPGIEHCAGGDFDGICVGQVVPTEELCNGYDDDCDGVVDNDCVQGATTKKKKKKGCAATPATLWSLIPLSGLVRRRRRRRAPPK